MANAEANAARMEGLKLRAVYAAKGQTYFSEKNGELAEKEGAHAGLTEQVASLEEQKQQLEALEEQGAAEAALAYDLDIAARLGTAELEADELRLLLVRVLREGAGSVTGLVNTIREKASHPPAEDPLSALLSQSKAEAVTDIATQLRTICTKSAETASTSAKEAGKAADEVKEKKTKAVNLQARLDANVAANQIPAILTMGNNALKAAKTSRKAAQTAKADAVKASATADAALKEANEQWDALEMAKAGSEALRSVEQSKTNADSASKAASSSAARCVQYRFDKASGGARCCFSCCCCCCCCSCSCRSWWWWWCCCCCCCCTVLSACTTHWLLSDGALVYCCLPARDFWCDMIAPRQA